MGKNKKSSSLYRKPALLEDKLGKKEPTIVFSLKHYDRNQGQEFVEWEEEKKLALLCEKLIGISQLTVIQATSQQIIKIYTKVDFPPESDFYHPKHVPEGIKWSSLHIQGEECVIGYFEENIFHIVFLDINHKFWISHKKNT